MDLTHLIHANKRIIPAKEKGPGVPGDGLLNAALEISEQQAEKTSETKDAKNRELVEMHDEEETSSPHGHHKVRCDKESEIKALESRVARVREQLEQQIAELKVENEILLNKLASDKEAFKLEKSDLDLKVSTLSKSMVEYRQKYFDAQDELELLRGKYALVVKDVAGFKNKKYGSDQQAAESDEGPSNGSRNIMGDQENHHYDPACRLHFAGMPVSLVMGNGAKTTIKSFGNEIGVNRDNVKDWHIPDTVQFPEKWNNRPLTGNQGYFYITTTTPEYAAQLQKCVNGTTHKFNGQDIELSVQFAHLRPYQRPT